MRSESHFDITEHTIPHLHLHAISKLYMHSFNLILPFRHNIQLTSIILNEKGFDPDAIEAALAHTGKNEVRNAYNRAEYIKRRVPLMSWWSEYIEKAATGNMSLSSKQGLRLIS